MSTQRTMAQGLKQVVPVLSANRTEARARVIFLYKTWLRQLPYLMSSLSLDVNEREAREKVKDEFRKNRHVTDFRVIDMLAIKGQNELYEAYNCFGQKPHLMRYFKDTENPRPKDFLGKFYDGHE